MTNPQYKHEETISGIALCVLLPGVFWAIFATIWAIFAISGCGQEPATPAVPRVERPEREPVEAPWGRDMPPEDYGLATNGKDWRFIWPSGELDIFRYLTREQAIEDAWRQFERSKESYKNVIPARGSPDYGT